MSPRVRTIAAAGLLVAMTIAAYWPATRAGYVWDDNSYVYANPVLRTAEGLARIWFDLEATPQYYPVVHTSYWLEFRLWGARPAGYHVVNILLHAIAALLLWRVLRLLEVPGAWAAAALFALHPVHVESVAWITERKNVLSAVLYLAAGLVYLRRALAPPSERSPGTYFAALALFAAALLSKTVTCSLPAALLLVLWWKRGRIAWRDVRPLVPFLVLGLALGLLTVWLEKTRVGAEGPAWDLSPLDRCLIAGRALWFYAGKLLWPHPLIFFYERWTIDAGAWRQYLWPAAAAAVVVALWLGRRRLGRGPLAAVLFFAGTLVPALGFFDVYPMRFSFVADHFQYLASIGLLALVAAAGARLATRLGPGGRNAGAVVLAAALAALGALTWNRTLAFADAETLWRDTLAKNPQAWLAHNNLGTILQSRGDLDGAIFHYRRAVEINPRSRAHNNLAALLRHRGDLDGAAHHFRRALDVLIRPPTTPGNRRYRGRAHHGLGMCLLATGAYDEALSHLEQAARFRPQWPEGLRHAAWLLATHPDPEARDPARAVRLAEQADTLTGRHDAGALDALAAARAAAGDLDGAVAAARRALRLTADPAAAAIIRQRLARYRSGEPYVLPAGRPPAPADPQLR